MDTEKTTQKESGFTLRNRNILSLYGVTDVISFDELGVYLVTEDGNLDIEGNDLHISSLDVANGKMEITGSIRTLAYQDKISTEKAGFFSKMFK